MHSSSRVRLSSARNCSRACKLAARRYGSSENTYNATLKLPTTTFPLRSKHNTQCNSSEHQDLYNWQGSRDRNTPKGRHEFILHDGPPYANGNLHIGHALNKILKDIVVRQKILEGYRVRYIPGWDCHGLPIEIKALQTYQSDSNIEDALTSSVSIAPTKIRAIAHRLAEETIKSQSEQFQKMAICADWRTPYKTLSISYQLAQIRIFAEMIEKGLIYRAEKPVYWSPTSRTALAEAELEYSENHVSHSAYIAYPISNSFQGRDQVCLIIWTTTPWTLPANRAISVNPELLYTMVANDLDGRTFVVCADISSANLEECLPGARRVGEPFQGVILTNLTYNDVFDSTTSYGRPILAADYVSALTGTGLVHTAPGHGHEDYVLCRAQNPPILPFAPVDDAGNYTTAVGIDDLVGLNVLGSGSKKVLEVLRSNSALLAVKKYRHRYPYDWRSKKPIIVRSTPQFFADLASIKERALAAIEGVKMIPPSANARLISYVKGRDEWCISRQRSWGVPIPALYNDQGALLMNVESVAHIIHVLEDKGVDSWFSEDTSADAWKKWVPVSYHNGQKWTRGRETLDVWFDSGCSWTTLQKNSNDGIVADLYLEGSDQHRGWFQSSLLTSIATRGIAPYKQVLTHGFLLDEKGRKMSKSLGNVIDPLIIIEGREAREPSLIDPSVSDKRLRKQLERSAREDASEIRPLGIDTLRLWVAQSDFTSDIGLSMSILTHVSEAVRKFRTTLRYMLGNLEDYDPSGEQKSAGPYQAIDNYALDISRKFRIEAERNYSLFSFNKVVSHLNRYTNSHLSAFYFNTLKDRLYADSTTSQSRLSAQRTLFEILKNYLAVLAPICPVLVNEVWSHLPKSLFKGIPHIYASNCALAPASNGLIRMEVHWEDLMQIRDLVNKQLEQARSEKMIASSLQASLKLTLPASLILPIPDQELANFFIVSQVTLERKGSQTFVEVNTASHSKCPRCWVYAAPVDGTLCARCDLVSS